MRMTARRLFPIVSLWIASAAPAGLAQDRPAELPWSTDRLAALDRISSDSLRGHLSFLASDLLEGRDTPSRGLDLAAEYIAAQFRRAGLEPVGDDGYFQTGDWDLSESPRDSFRLRFEEGEASTQLGIDDVALPLAGARSFRFEGAPLIKVDFRTYAALRPDEVAGKAVIVEFPARRGNAEEQNAAGVAISTFRMWAASAGAAIVIVVNRDPAEVLGLGNPTLTDPKAPEAPGRAARRDAPGRGTSVSLRDPRVVRLFDASPVGPIAAKVSATLGEPVQRRVKLRNVAGVLRGSDPALKETYVMATAHYDHIGIRGPAGTDRVHNGANDDGSGTVSVIEVASALATLKDRPRRSLLFVAFFGEEKGLLGSRYYGRNPLVPIDKTVADINLEQVGRTDDSEGARVGSAALTGFGYSDVSRVFVASGEREGIKVVRHPRNSDLYFGRSDNQALADLGVPAHTLCVAFQFADYHGAADHWDKVDYANMARVDRMVARALLTLADDPAEPRWDEANPRAARYLKAWRDRRANR